MEKVILDVRTKEEYDNGHVENAVNIDFYSKDLKKELKKLDKSKKYKVYCRSGARSQRVVEIMKKMGFDVEDFTQELS
jgi:rhodanese-related sulfurtransferase